MLLDDNRTSETCCVGGLDERQPLNCSFVRHGRWVRSCFPASLQGQGMMFFIRHRIADRDGRGWAWMRARDEAKPW